jgi:uncharacterized protein (DUF2147 family)
MKTRFTLALAATLSFTAAAGADPIEGVWQTQVDDGAFAHVTVAPCGGAYCGTISRTFEEGAEYRSENIGRQILRAMVPQGGGAYEGEVWRPSNDKIYLGKVQLDGDRMTLRGCVAGGLFCARQNWVRVN